MTPEELSKFTMSGKYPWIKETTVTELKALFGFFYARGLFKQNYWSYKRIWDGLIGHTLFEATMSKYRFLFLLKHFTFDDPTTRTQRWKYDSFAACREIFEMWNRNCGEAVNSGEFITIDECL